MEFYAIFQLKLNFIFLRFSEINCRWYSTQYDFQKEVEVDNINLSPFLHQLMTRKKGLINQFDDTLSHPTSTLIGSRTEALQGHERKISVVAQAGNPFNEWPNLTATQQWTSSRSAQFFPLKSALNPCWQKPRSFPFTIENKKSFFLWENSIDVILPSFNGKFIGAHFQNWNFLAKD